MPDDTTTQFSLINPVTTGFLITNHFNSPRPYANGRHEGVDLRATFGGQPAEIVAAQSGVIDRIKEGNTGYGNYVRVRHEWPDGTIWVSWYAHLATISPALQVGDEVEVGQRLGIAGTTGNSTGVHLHLTLQHLGYGLSGYVIPDVVDPTRYLKGVSVAQVDEMIYLADVTVPDGSLIEAGKPFEKTWRVRNTGTSRWDNYTLTHFTDNQMSGPENVPLPPLKPGESGEISVPLVAPTLPGRHRTTWKGRNSRGRLFAFELYADIVVSPVARRDDSVFVTDVTLPDGQSVAAGQEILKTWRVRNTGDTTWNETYRLVHIEDELLEANPAIASPIVRPGATADLSVILKAPQKAGIYRSTWRLRNAEGVAFGASFYAEFRVVVPPGKPKDDAEYVGDITVLDGTRMEPGYSFTKTWRIRNTGQSTWGDGYTLAFAGDHQFGGPAAAPLPATGPGQYADVSLELTAPMQPGRHRSTWQPRSAEGKFFGDLLVTDIEVIRPGMLDNATFYSDVNYPDGAIAPAGERFIKTWRIQNSGSSAWGPGYALVFVADNHMNGPDSIPLPAALPGEVVDLSVTLEAPLTPGTHRSTWRARNREGVLFGDLLYAEIRVPISSTPGSNALEDAQLEAHVTFPDGSEVGTGEAFEKTWAVRNTGSVTWTSGYELVFVGGSEMSDTRRIPVPEVPPQRVVNLSADLAAPGAPGRHIGRWRMRNPRGDFFGSTVFVSIIAVETPAKYDMLTYLRGDGRLYEMKHIFEMPHGPLIGQQRVQTQREGIRFYQTKNSEWEELWADERFIYRGTDTSPGSGNFYTLMDGDRYGTAWIPRQMTVGQTFRRSVMVVSRRKGNCMANSHLSGRHITWIKLEAMKSTMVLPDVEGRPGRGFQARDVAVMAAFNEVNGRPAVQPFERYYYAKGFGLIMWEGIATDHKGISFLVQLHGPGDRPNNVRERIPCLDGLRP